MLPLKQTLEKHRTSELQGEFYVEESKGNTAQFNGGADDPFSASHPAATAAKMNSLHHFFAGKLQNDAGK